MQPCVRTCFFYFFLFSFFFFFYFFLFSLFSFFFFLSFERCAYGLRQRGGIFKYLIVLSPAIALPRSIKCFLFTVKFSKNDQEMKIFLDISDMFGLASSYFWPPTLGTMWVSGINSNSSITEDQLKISILFLFCFLWPSSNPSPSLSRVVVLPL